MGHSYTQQGRQAVGVNYGGSCSKVNISLSLAK